MSNDTTIQFVPLYSDSTSLTNNINTLTTSSYNYQSSGLSIESSDSTTALFRESIPAKTMLHIGYSRTSSYSRNSSDWGTTNIQNAYNNSNFNLYLIYAYDSGSSLEWNWIQSTGTSGYKRGSTSKTVTTKTNGYYEIDVINDIINSSSTTSSSVKAISIKTSSNSSLDSLYISGYQNNSNPIHMYVYNHDTTSHDIVWGRITKSHFHRGTLLQNASPDFIPIDIELDDDTRGSIINFHDIYGSEIIGSSIHFYDSGGSGGNYGNSQNYNIVFDVGEEYHTKLTFVDFEFEHNSSRMYDRMGIQV